MEINYPKFCDFCSTRIKSRHCLLPWYFVYKYKLPNDPKEALIDLSQIHSEYGTGNLNANLEFMARILNRPDHATAVRYAESLSSYSGGGIPLTVPVSISTSPESSDHGAHSLPSRDDEAKFDLPTETETVRDSPTVKDEQPANNELENSSADTDRSATPKLLTTLFKKTSSSVTSDDITHVEPTSSAIDEVNLNKDKEEIFHLVKDVSRAIITAYSLHQSYRHEYNIVRFHECLTTEMGILKASGTNYKPTHDSKLDHPIALAKELAAIHAFEDIVNWANGTACLCSSRCILNYPRLKSVSMTSDSDTLFGVLCDYSRSVITDPKLSNHDRELLSSQVITETRRRGFTTAYQWVKNQAKGKSVHKTTPFPNKHGLSFEATASRSPESSQTFRSSAPQGSKRSHQTMDPNDRLNLVLTDILPKVVNQHLNSNKEFNQIQIESYSPKQVMTKLLEALIRYNQGWRNPVTTRSIQSITRLEPHLEFSIPDEQVEVIYNIFKPIIDQIVKETKQ